MCPLDSSDPIKNEFQAMADKATANQKAHTKTERKKEHQKQLDAGRCNIQPLPKVATQPFRSEITVEQNSLFVSNAFKGDHFVREWTTNHPDSGEPIKRRVIIGKVHEKDRSYGVLTQTHQDALYLLLQTWAEHGYPVVSYEDKAHGYITISAYKLVIMLWNSDNAREYQRTQSLLRNLAAIPIVIENTYTWQGLCDRDEFTLIANVSWSERGVDQKTRRPIPTGKSEVSILLSPLITKGFLDKRVKTLLGEPYKSLRDKEHCRPNEIARLLYPFLDAQLATKNDYHCSLVSLAERFGLMVYRYKSRRYQQFQTAVKVLDGKPIQGERFVLNVQLEEAANAKDFVLVARRRLAVSPPNWSDSIR